MAVRIVGDQSELSGDPLQGMGPAMLDYLRTRLDLSMVADAPGVSRYAVSSVDAGNVPSLTGSSSISGGGGGTGVTSVFGRSGSVIALTGDYAAFYLGLTATAVAAVKLATARTINGVAFDGTANIIVAAAAGTLTGATLAANVLNSSLTSVGTLTALTVTATITGSVSGNAATVTTNADLTGPVTSVGNATAVTANAITNAMLAQMATLTLKGNNTGATGNALDLTAAQVNAILPVFTSTLNGLAPLSGGGTANFLRADGTWNEPPGTPDSVSSVFGRTGAVVALLGDYTLTDVTDALTLLPIGTGDGTTTAFNLPTGWLAGSSIYKSDWQGNQLQYSTPRTNYQLQSTNLLSADWTLTNITTASSGVKPDGSDYSTIIADNATYGNHGLLQAYSLAVLANNPIYISAVVKNGTINYAELRIGDNNGNVAIVWFDLVTGAYASNYTPAPYSLVSYQIVPLTNGYYFIQGVFSSSIAISSLNQAGVFLNNGGNDFYIGTGSTLEAVAFQVSLNPGSIIPTTSSPVTVTDYSLNSTQITFSTAPLNLAVLTAETGRAAVINGPDLWGVLQVDLYGRALIDFSQTTHLNKNLDNIPDGVTRFAVPAITGILYGTGSGVAAAIAADFPVLNQSTTGNAGSATQLQTARTIDGVSFNGTANISIPLDDVPDGPTNYVRRTQQSGNSINVDVPDALFQLGTGSTAPPGWTVITSNGTLSYPTTAPVPLYGFQYLEITATAVAPTVLETVASWKAKPGDVVTLGAAAGILTAGDAVIGIEWYEGTGTAISESFIGNIGALAAITPASFVAPALTAYFKLRISQSSVVAIGDKALFNEVACSINDVRANSFGNIAPATTALVSATTYQNTTGGPIVLYIPISYTNTITTGTVQVFLGPSSVPGQIFENESSLAATATVETITLMVPNNWYYKLLINAAATIGTVYMVQGI